MDVQLCALENLDSLYTSRSGLCEIVAVFLFQLRVLHEISLALYAEFLTLTGLIGLDVDKENSLSVQQKIKELKLRSGQANDSEQELELSDSSEDADDTLETDMSTVRTARRKKNKLAQKQHEIASGEPVVTLELASEQDAIQAEVPQSSVVPSTKSSNQKESNSETEKSDDSDTPTL